MRLEDLDELFDVLQRFTGYADVVLAMINGGAALFQLIRDRIAGSPSGELSVEEIAAIVRGYVARLDAEDERYAQEG